MLKSSGDFPQISGDHQKKKKKHVSGDRLKDSGGHPRFLVLTSWFFYIFSSSGDKSGDFSKSSGDFPQTFWRYLGELHLSHENDFGTDRKLKTPAFDP